MKLNQSRLILISFVFLTSCNYNVSKQSSAPFSETAQNEISSNFEAVKKNIFTPNCVQCHQQYNTYQNVYRELTSIKEAILSNRMPKSGSPLDENQKNVILDWIAKGAPENSSGPITETEPDKLNATWNSISKNVIYPKCLVCHNPLGQAKFLDLSSRNIIFSQRNRTFADGSKLMDFDRPEQSYLIKIIEDSDEPMPPVESNISRLTLEEVKVLTEWISQGIP